MLIFPLAVPCYGIDFSDYPNDWPKVETPQEKCSSFSGEYKLVGEVLNDRDIQGRMDTHVFNVLFDDRTEKIQVVYNAEESVITAHAVLKLSPDSREAPPHVKTDVRILVSCENGIPVIKYGYPWGSSDGTLNRAKMQRHLFLLPDDGSLIVLALADVEVRHLFIFSKKKHIRRWFRFLPAEEGK